MTDLDVIEKVKDIFQTKIFSHQQQKRPHINSTKTIHQIWLDGNNAVELIKEFILLWEKDDVLK